MGRNCNPGDAVRKDNDLLDDGFRLKLGPNREPVLAQIRRDVELLRSLGFVDYSLCIGARLKKARASPVNLEDAEALVEEDGPTHFMYALAFFIF